MLGSTTFFFLPLFMLLKPALSTPITVKVSVETETSHAITVPSDHHHIDAHTSNTHLGLLNVLIAVNLDGSAPEGGPLFVSVSTRPYSPPRLALLPSPAPAEIKNGYFFIKGQPVSVTADGFLYQTIGPPQGPRISWDIKSADGVGWVLAPSDKGGNPDPVLFTQGLFPESLVYACGKTIDTQCPPGIRPFMLKVLPWVGFTENSGTQEILEL